MPCISDWPKPTEQHQRNQRSAQMMLYVCQKQKRKISITLKQDADDEFCHTNYTVALCGLLKCMPDDERDALIYNARDPQARKLADWWEKHQKQDAVREKVEAEARRIDQLQASAENKLTDDEILALKERYRHG